MRKAIARLQFYVVTCDTELLELMFGLLKFGWGVKMLLPGDTFANPLYSILKKLGTENEWGLFLILLGSFQIVALAIGNLKYRACASLLISAMWVFLAIVYVLADYTTVSIWSMPLYAVTCFYCYHRRIKEISALALTQELKARSE